MSKFDMRDLLATIKKQQKCIDQISEVFFRVYKCECKQVDEHGCHDCQNNGVIPECELSGAVFHSIKELEESKK